MLRTLTLAAGLTCGAMLAGCTADAAPKDTIDRGPAMNAEEADTAPPTFEVRWQGETRAEAILQRFLDAGHAQISEACEINPVASVRAYNPLASGACADVPCAAILRDEETSAETQQPLAPAGLMRGLLSIGVELASTWSCERYADPGRPWSSAAGSSTISLSCMLL